MPQSTCSIAGCESISRCKELCNKHYLRMRNHGDPLYRIKPEGRQVCVVEGCGNLVAANGLCAMHDMRKRRSGSLELPKRMVRSCIADGCGKRHYAHNLCQKHYLRKWSGLDIRLPSDVVDGKKLCTRCLIIFPIESFGVSARLASGRNIYCSSCLSDLQHIRRAQKRATEYESVSRDVVLSRDGWECHLCGEAIPPEAQWPDPLSASMDHVTPLARGGSHTYENIKSAHLTCNIGKGARIPA